MTLARAKMLAQTLARARIPRGGNYPLNPVRSRSSMSVRAGPPVVMGIGQHDEHAAAVEKLLQQEGYEGRTFPVARVAEAKQELLRTAYDLVMLGTALPKTAPEAVADIRAFITANCPGTEVHQITLEDVVAAGFEAPQGPPPSEMVAKYAVAVAKRVKPMAV